jgi:RNA polymerase sigma factor (sigma-70 family)
VHEDSFDEERMVEKHFGLVRAVVAKTLRLYSHLPGGLDREDLESHGRIGLLQAIRSYDPGRGAQFSTYAYQCIKNQIVGALAQEQTGEFVIVAFPDVTDGEEDRPHKEIQDDGPGPAQMTEREDVRQRLLAAIRQLPPPFSTIVENVYYGDTSLTEVARKIGVSPYRAQMLHHRALQMLRRRFPAPL